MATDAPLVKFSKDFSVITYYWAGLDSGDDGAPVKVPEYADKTVQLTGTFDTATVTIEGSNGSLTTSGSDVVETAPSADADYFTLSNAHANAASYTAAGGDAITENTMWIRPHVTGGTGSTDVNVCLVVRRPTDLRT